MGTESNRARQGDVLSTSMGPRALRLGEPLAEGGQGSVFSVEGEEVVVKLYHPALLSGPKRNEQLSRLCAMVAEGAPSAAFAWPIDVIEDPALGYVMPRVPESYVSLRKLNWDVGRWNWALRLRMSFRLAQALASLHLRRGCAYCDLSSTNVLCDPDSGDIKVIDLDNLTVDGQKSCF